MHRTTASAMNALDIGLAGSTVTSPAKRVPPTVIAPFLQGIQTVLADAEVAVELDAETGRETRVRSDDPNPLRPPKHESAPAQDQSAGETMR
ncbi:hypothetical protein ABN028_14675 [Actinopolymorpha sp. B17G11]|uniref:hypothetical protein n=1 Tax=unclassified Actinopolymorpha TaxID=2627063 RepID=UPI0032D965D9